MGSDIAEREPNGKPAGRRDGPRRASLRPTWAALCLGAVVWSVTPFGHAASWETCSAPFIAPAKPATDPPPTDPKQYDASAEQADLSEGGVSTLTGDVHILRSQSLLTADKVTYDEPNEELLAEGNAQYWENGFYVASDAATVDIQNDRIDTEGVSFLDEGSHGRGDAKRIQLFGSDLVKGQDIRYTTCLPGNSDWVLQARNLDLNYETDVGTARDVKLFFKDVPIFYFPYVDFPLTDARKSGFLIPSARLSGPAGLELLIPYYFNIAPNHDATLTARLTSRRGPIVRGEYRYLQPWGRGEAKVEIVPDDLERGGSRGLFGFRHRGRFAPGWTAELDYNHVSDRDYFGELGDSLNLASTTHLRRRANVLYRAKHWSIRSRLESFQTVDDTIAAEDRPYERLPQLLFRTHLPRRNFRPYLDARVEAARFEREDSVTGNRIDIDPTVGYTLRRSWGFIHPRIGVRHTAYSLDDNTLGSDDVSRTTATFSTDAGLFFERNFDWEGQGYVQTIEPRVFYLATPFIDQDDIPIFDTGEFTFNFSQLFREDRFTGGDRVGDAHQLSAALTTRILSRRTGREVLRASVGQIRYLRDRRVQRALATEAATQTASPFVAEVTGAYGPWTLSAGTQWDSHEDRFERNTFALRYQPLADRVINARYRFVRDVTEQVDFSFRWPWRSHIDLVGRFTYALSDDRLLETFGGVEYESCCWAFRTVFRRFLSNSSGDYNNGIFLQLELKGLAGIGNRAEAFLDRSIPGYRNDF
ncbi:MAG: LPS assembly protein LptD [Pseudomonadota bacterium]